MSEEREVEVEGREGAEVTIAKTVVDVEAEGEQEEDVADDDSEDDDEA